MVDCECVPPTISPSRKRALAKTDDIRIGFEFRPLARAPTHQALVATSKRVESAAFVAGSCDTGDDALARSSCQIFRLGCSFRRARIRGLRFKMWIALI